MNHIKTLNRKVKHDTILLLYNLFISWEEIRIRNTVYLKKAPTALWILSTFNNMLVI